MPAVIVQGDIYVVGGYGPSGLRSDMEKIEVGEPLKISALPTALKARGFHTAEAFGPFIYVLGGVAREDEGFALTLGVERFDTRDGSVQLMAPLPFGVRTPASVLVGEKIYVAGGSNEDGERVDSLLIYDIAANTWTAGAALPEKKECDLLAWGGGLLATGGFDGEVATKGVHFYDIATGVWSSLPALPFPTSAHHGAVVRDENGAERVVLFGDYAQLDRVQSGNPREGVWQSLNRTGFIASRHAAVVTLGDKIYVIGGNIASSRSFLDDVQVFEAEDLAAG